MSLVLEQTFLLGRFHATRWNQNPFEDPFGEWPPSPWRLLRALAARWFQYSRETADEDATTRDDLLLKLASSIPQFSLPALTWRGRPVRQYHPTGLEEQYKYRKDRVTRRQVLDYSFKQVGRTLVVDQYRAVPETEPVYWVFEFRHGELAESQSVLLRRLVERTLYFGRAESHCRIRTVTELPAGRQINCTLSKTRGVGATPVLAADPDTPLDMSILLAATDDKLIAGHPIPPGTKWYYVLLPPPPRLTVSRPPERRYPSDLRVLQFAVGGRVFPPPDRRIKIAERFRGGALNAWSRSALNNPLASYRDLRGHQKADIMLLSGKDADGHPLAGHRHAYFILWSEEDGQPTRLVVYRRTPFRKDEIDAMLRASQRLYSWEAGNPEWVVRLVPLPFTTAAPAGLGSEKFRIWSNLTPFVSPVNRHRFRVNGRERRGEFPDEILRKLLLKHGFPEPQRIEGLDGGARVRPQTLGDWSAIAEWVQVHETRHERQRRQAKRGRAVRPGFRLEVEFAKPVRGPICLGHCSHFGLGLFVPCGP